MTAPPRLVKRCRCTQEQKRVLVERMAGNKDLALGTFVTVEGVNRNRQQWRELVSELNKLGPAKTVSQWKITWRDLKSKAKLKHVSYSGQNACKSEPSLSTDEEQIISIFGSSANREDPLSTTSAEPKTAAKSAATSRRGIHSTINYHTPTVAALKDISKRLKERNEIEAERNDILREKNRILQLYLDHSMEQLVEVVDDE